MALETPMRRTVDPRLLYELTQTVAAARSLDEIYEAALTCLCGTLGVERASILLFDADDVMRFKAWRGLSDNYRAATTGHTPWTRDTTDAEPVVVEDVLADESLAGLREIITGEGIRSLAFVPLALGTRLLGKFMVYGPEPHAFNADELMVAQTIAAQIAFAVDIARRRELDQAVYESERRYRNLIEGIGLAVYTVDRNGYITHYNEEAANFWGVRPVIGEARWCGTAAVYHPDGQPMAVEDWPIAVAMRENTPVRDREIIAELVNGERRTLIPQPSPLHDVNGNVIGAVNVLVDITTQQETRAALVAALRAKDDFLGQVSHELRTPLTQLVGNSHLLVNRWTSLDDDIRRESIEEIHVQAQRLHRLVDNMMVLSRLERGIKPETEPHLIQRLIGATLKEFQARFPNCQLDISIDKELHPVEVSSSTIDQVLWNMLTNAQKYGPPRGPVTVRARNDGDWVCVSVADRGPGVPESEMDRLFEPYFRSSSTAEHAAGLGLGLSVCRRLLESQDGRISAQRLEPGMEFVMSLPGIKE